MKKRLLSFLLALVMLLTLLPLSACGNGGAGAKTDSGAVTQGELLDQICEVFGMTGYRQETAYFPSVSADNPHFQAVQACVEWNIIAEGTQDYDVAARLTRGALALAVVNAAQLAAEDAAEQEKLDIAAQKALVLLKRDGTIDKKKKVKREEMEHAVAAAQAIWANPQYETLSQYSAADGVTDLGAEGAEIQDFTIDRSNHRVTLPAAAAENLHPGTVYLLPAENGLSAVEAHRVGSIQKDGETVIVTNEDSGLTLDDVVGEVQMQSTFVPDFTQQAIVDGNGNAIQWETAGGASQIAANDSAAGAQFLNAAARPLQGEPLAFGDGVKGKFAFKVSGVKIAGEVSANSIQFGAAFPINDNMEISHQFQISDFNVSAKVDRDKWKILRGARLQFDYKTTSKTAFKSELKASSFHRGNAFSSGADYMSGLNGLLEDIAYDNSVSGFNYDGANAKGCSKSIGILSVPLGTICGIGTVNLEIKLEFTLEGSVELKLTTSAVSGVQYDRRGGLRAIYSKNTNSALDFKAGLEALLYIGGVLNVLGFNLIDIGIKIGVGAEAGSTVHLVDYSEAAALGVELASARSPLPADILAVASNFSLPDAKKVETCTEINIFFILRIAAGSNSIVGKLATLELEVCGSKNTPFSGCPIHIEDGAVVAQCTRAYRTPEEPAPEPPQDAEETVPAGEDSDSAADGQQPGETDGAGSAAGGQQPGEFDHLDLSNYYVSLTPGESERVTISALPRGYTEADVVCISENSAIAVISNDGTITAVAAGTTEVSFATSDGKFSCRCAVSVKASAPVEGSFLGSAGGSGRIEKL